MHSPLLCPPPRLFPIIRLCLWLLPVLAFHFSASRALAVSDIVVKYTGGSEITDSATVNFSTVNVGATASRSFTITNGGATLLTNINFTINGANAADYTLNASNLLYLDLGSSYTFTVTFHPSQPLARTAAVHIASNDPNENPFDINFTGIGVAPEISISTLSGNLTDGTSTLNFGKVKVGFTGTRQVAIRNTGNAPLTGLGVSVSGSAYSVSTLSVTTLASGASTQVTLSFTPSGTFTSTGSLRIFSNDADESTFDVALTGTGVIPILEVESPPGTLIFDGADTLVLNAPVGQQTQRQFLIRNVSPGTLTGITLTLDGADAANFSNTALPADTLSAGNSMTFSVSFTAPALTASSAALHIAVNQLPADPFDIALSGNGVTLPDDGDEDGDGVLNMLEAAMGTDPLTPGPEPDLVKNGASLELTITRSVAGQNTYSLWVEYSDDPAGMWTPLDASFAILDNDNGTVQTLRYVFPAGDSGHRFARVRATKL